MVSQDNKLITRKDSFIFFQLNCLPVHPYVLSEFKKTKNLDYDLMGKSLDLALDWTYKDLKENPDILPENSLFSPLQTSDRKSTLDLEVIVSWLKQGKHSYYFDKNGCNYTTKDRENFPFKSLSLVDSGIYFGAKPIILLYDKGLIFKHDLEYFGKEKLLSDSQLKEFEIKDEDKVYIVPATWYTKDANPIIKLFGKNFITNYNNLMIQQKYK